jgi:ERCC4-type nuclease
MFKIITDSREKQPYSFRCPGEVRRLPAGDYSVASLERVVAVERKSLSDFVRTVIHDRRRFEVELEKLEDYREACVVVEACLDRMLRGELSSRLRGVPPEAVVGAALDIALRHHVPVIWCGSRQAARFFTEQYLRMAARLHGKAKS